MFPDANGMNPISNIPQILGMRFRLVESPFIVKEFYRLVPRTWRERLFSRPWRPLVGIKEVIDYVPMEKVAIIENGGQTLVIGHPKVILNLVAQLHPTTNCGCTQLQQDG